MESTLSPYDSYSSSLELVKGVHILSIHFTCIKYDIVHKKSLCVYECCESTIDVVLIENATFFFYSHIS